MTVAHMIEALGHAMVPREFFDEWTPIAKSLIKKIRAELVMIRTLHKADKEWTQKELNRSSHESNKRTQAIDLIQEIQGAIIEQRGYHNTQLNQHVMEQSLDAFKAITLNKFADGEYWEPLSGEEGKNGAIMEMHKEWQEYIRHGKGLQDANAGSDNAHGSETLEQIFQTGGKREAHNKELCTLPLHKGEDLAHNAILKEVLRMHVAMRIGREGGCVTKTFPAKRKHM